MTRAAAFSLLALTACGSMLDPEPGAYVAPPDAQAEARTVCAAVRAFVVARQPFAALRSPWSGTLYWVDAPTLSRGTAWLVEGGNWANRSRRITIATQTPFDYRALLAHECMHDALGTLDHPAPWFDATIPLAHQGDVRP